MILLKNILEQDNKKIRLNKLERLNLKLMLLKDEDLDKFVEEIYNNISIPLQKYMSHYHIPKEFKNSFDRNDNGRVIRSMVMKSFDRIFLPQNTKQGYEKTKTFKAKFERTILKDYIVYWIRLDSPYILPQPTGLQTKNLEFWLIKKI